MEYTEDMEKDLLQDNVNWLFVSASLRAKKGFIRLAEELELSVIQVFALCFLQPKKPMPMKEMASLLMCEPSNVTGIIDKLFARSYIAREENPKDRRIKMISLTDEGTELRQKIVKNIVDYKSDRLERLTPAEQQDLKKMMLKILA